MSAFQGLATPAPQVERAIAEKALDSGAVQTDPAMPSDDPVVEPAKPVEPATVDECKRYPIVAPTKAESANLSVEVLRGSGSEFESKVSNSEWNLFWQFFFSSSSSSF